MTVNIQNTLTEFTKCTRLSPGKDGTGDITSIDVLEGIDADKPGAFVILFNSIEFGQTFIRLESGASRPDGQSRWTSSITVNGIIRTDPASAREYADFVNRIASLASAIAFKLALADAMGELAPQP